jgi:hypothetical protein
MPRTCKRKTERANIAQGVFIRAGKLEHMAIRGAAKDFGIVIGSRTRYYSKASEEGVRGTSQNHGLQYWIQQTSPGEFIYIYLL